jgi:O-antigen ligase
MIERVPKSIFVVGASLAVLMLAYVAYSRPWYFTSQMYLGGLLFLEVLIAVVWMYRRFFFPVLVLTFLFAGVNLPGGGGVWTAARWVVLSVGALVGVLMVLREGRIQFRSFHLLAFFAVLSLLVSVTVSRNSTFTLLKVLSVLLVFVYGGTGARIAATGREDRFFRGLLIGCEVFVGANGLFYGLGIQAMGNPNSLGAVMGVMGAPILLWGVFLARKRSVQLRRLILYAICVYLTFASQARAGILAALLCSALLCFALRKYTLIIEGAVVLVILMSGISIYRPESFPHFFSSIVYKNSQGEAFASRFSPWQRALNAISDHPWFGTGLGTAVDGPEASEGTRMASSSELTTENGNSYLALLSGGGILCASPFFLLLFALTRKIIRTVIWIRTSASAVHPAIPLAMLIVAGLVHAAFEDWMFASGNYMCVFFWSLVFIFVDVAPLALVSRSVAASGQNPRQHVFARVTSNS